MAKTLGLTEGQVTSQERDALIDDAFYSNQASAPVHHRTRSHERAAATSESATDSSDKRETLARRRRSKTPECSPREQKEKERVRSLGHAKARLTLDKPKAAKNQPAEIIPPQQTRPTRSNTIAPAIWPLPPRTAPPHRTLKKDTKDDVSQEEDTTSSLDISRRSSKTPRTPP